LSHKIITSNTFKKYKYYVEFSGVDESAFCLALLDAPRLCLLPMLAVADTVLSASAANSRFHSQSVDIGRYAKPDQGWQPLQSTSPSSSTGVAGAGDSSLTNPMANPGRFEFGVVALSGELLF